MLDELRLELLPFWHARRDPRLVGYAIDVRSKVSRVRGPINEPPLSIVFIFSGLYLLFAFS
jgi:hypothetical protein